MRRVNIGGGDGSTFDKQRLPVYYQNKRAGDSKQRSFSVSGRETLDGENSPGAPVFSDEEVMWVGGGSGARAGDVCVGGRRPTAVVEIGLGF